MVDNTAAQVLYSTLVQVRARGSVLDFRLIRKSFFRLNGTAVRVEQLPGLPASASGYCLYGALAPQAEGPDGEFACVAIALDDGRAWSRSLRGMQPKFGACHYGQRLRLACWPDGWLLLDIDGDNFGLQDAAWLWHLPTDRQFAIPLAAVTFDRENAALHHHPQLDCLFAHCTRVDGDDSLEMLRPMNEVLAVLMAARATRRTAGPWIEEPVSNSAGSC